MFDPSRPKSERGFDAVLGKPAWEVLQLSDVEFFATLDPRIATSIGAARKKLIKDLANSDDPAHRRVYAEFERAKHSSDAQGEFVRGSGRWPLTTSGKLNTYALFAELFLRLIKKRGRAGVVVPTGIATDDSTKDFFRQSLRVDDLPHFTISRRVAAFLTRSVTRGISFP